MDGWRDREIETQMDGCMDGWIDRQIGRQIDRLLDRQLASPCHVLAGIFGLQVAFFVPFHALVQLLQAVIASSCCRTSSGLTKVLVRLAMTLHTWSRIVMWCISSNRCLTSMEYFDLKALAISAYTDLKKNIYVSIARSYNTLRGQDGSPTLAGAMSVRRLTQHLCEQLLQGRLLPLGCSSS